MINVIEVLSVTELPDDDASFVVCPTMTGPAYASRAVFEKNRRLPNVRVAPSHWDAAVERAIGAAGRSNVLAVYVIGRGQ